MTEDGLLNFSKMRMVNRSIYYSVCRKIVTVKNEREKWEISRIENV